MIIRVYLSFYNFQNKFSFNFERSDHIKCGAEWLSVVHRALAAVVEFPDGEVYPEADAFALNEQLVELLVGPLEQEVEDEGVLQGLLAVLADDVRCAAVEVVRVVDAADGAVQHLRAEAGADLHGQLLAVVRAVRLVIHFAHLLQPLANARQVLHLQRCGNILYLWVAR